MPLVQVCAAQQYNFSLRGYQPLLSWAQQHTAGMHSPPAAAGHQTLITNGGNHTLEVRHLGGCGSRGPTSRCPPLVLPWDANKGYMSGDFGPS